MDTETLTVCVSMRATFQIHQPRSQREPWERGWEHQCYVHDIRRSKRYMRAFGTADYPVTIETLRNLKLEG